MRAMSNTKWRHLLPHISRPWRPNRWSCWSYVRIWTGEWVHVQFTPAALMLMIVCWQSIWLYFLSCTWMPQEMAGLLVVCDVSIGGRKHMWTVTKKRLVGTVVLKAHSHDHDGRQEVQQKIERTPVWICTAGCPERFERGHKRSFRTNQEKSPSMTFFSF